MVYCFAYGCSNGDASKKAFFKFPPKSKPKQRAQWIQAINRLKSDVDRAKAAKLCEDHFEPHSFNKHPEIAREVKCILRLKEGAVPDRALFVRGKQWGDVKGKPRTSLAFQKRQNIEVSTLIY